MHHRRLGFRQQLYILTGQITSVNNLRPLTQQTQ